MKLLIRLAIAASLVLTGCGSSSEDILLEDSSELAPDSGDQPVLSNLPGGDTSAIAGYWEVLNDGASERYIEIASNGLWTEYFLTYEGNTPGNCYGLSEAQTLTPEDPATHAYSLADGRALSLETDEDAGMLMVGYLAEDRESEQWSAVTGRLPEDLPLCNE